MRKLTRQFALLRVICWGVMNKAANAIGDFASRRMARALADAARRAPPRWPTDDPRPHRPPQVRDSER